MEEFDEFKDPVMRKQIIEALKRSEEDIEKGNVRNMEEIFKEWDEEFGKC